VKGSTANLDVCLRHEVDIASLIHNLNAADSQPQCSSDIA